jgi:hypothetical protein
MCMHGGLLGGLGCAASGLGCRRHSTKYHTDISTQSIYAHRRWPDELTRPEGVPNGGARAIRHAGPGRRRGHRHDSQSQ